MSHNFRHFAIVHFDRFVLSLGIVFACLGLLGISVHFELGRNFWLGPISLLIVLTPLLVFFSWFRLCTCGTSLETAQEDPIFLKMQVDRVMQGGAYLLCGILVGCHLTEGKWAALFGEIAFCLIGLASIYSGAFGGAKRVGQEIRFLLTGNMELLEQRDCDRLATLARDIGETSKADKLTCIKASE